MEFSRPGRVSQYCTGGFTIRLGRVVTLSQTLDRGFDRDPVTRTPHMTDPPKPAIALCTCPHDDAARRLARMLVESRLAACVNIVPGVRSIYEWQGRIEDDQEVLMVIKTDGVRFDALCERLGQAHPYDVPEILKLDVDGGLPAYLDWMTNWLRKD